MSKPEAKVFSKTVLYENDEVLAVYKQPGISVHPGHNAGQSLIGRLKKDISPKLELLHRLDRETSGILMLTKDKGSAAEYGRLLSEGTKKYLVICKGGFRKKEFIIDEDIGDRHVKEAVTGIRVLQSFSSYTMLEAHLITGRTHQIRIHLNQKGHPVLGDRKYGDFELNREIKSKYGISGLFLHSWKLNMKDSRNGKIRISCPPPPHFTEFLNRFNISYGGFS